ncbi:flavin reductase family protein [Roseovarius nubinhibens]|uniref:Flavin reductase like domain-containing protein n=1 Tax=Roseovarius nubinhibens (strain ATCC BAA-591 / DSM 15170 / ISM) TaxID=89187 RepID=A3SQV5_ROSNI|nr:flavin reductase [Roseovarius nubinhibens]EAP75514.1 hypothetical protein ISM_10336 [Roseovarius nubinhibens ISM]
MLDIDLGKLDPRDRYKLLCGVVIPRPIAWVTTCNPDGSTNLAPFSFFNVFGADPATVILGLEHHADGTPKDTTRNIERTGEFVVHMLTPDLNAVMVDSAARYAPGASETEALGLATQPSKMVAPPRLALAPVALECRKTVGLSLSPERCILVGEALAISARDGLIDLDTCYVNWGETLPTARLFADRYARLVESDRLTIPAPLAESSTRTE